MAELHLDPELRAELARLALLPDSAIDTSDIPETIDWSEGRRSAFYNGSIKSGNYDVRAIANWFLNKLQSIGKGVSNFELNKLVYFAIERALVEKGFLLTPARVEAWEHGPVIREIYHAFKGNDRETIRTRIERYSIPDRQMIEARDTFSPDDEALFSDIADSYGRMTASQLYKLAHEENGPWHVVWRRRGQVNPGMEISPQIILRQAPSKRYNSDRL
jgi:uncharacterized phage-associated protein